jgi:GNAT superfamily N-acetyltransferase
MTKEEYLALATDRYETLEKLKEKDNFYDRCKKTLTRTNSDNPDFHLLIKELDCDLEQRNGDSQLQYNAYNKMDSISYVVIVYIGKEPVGCGAIREYSPDTMEVKRMFVSKMERKKGIASIILDELENWTKELGFKRCILETGTKLPEAIGLYEKKDYTRIPNYGQYECLESSVCFAKKI